MNKKLVSYLKSAAKLIVTVVILYFVFTKIQVKDVFAVFMQSDWYFFIPGLLFFILSKWIASERLFLFLFQLIPSLNKLINLKLYLLGMFYNLFLPGGIGGDGYKVYFLHQKYAAPTKKAIWAVLIDRIIGMLSLLFLAMMFSSFIQVSFPAKHWILLLIPAGYGVYLFIIQKWFSYFKPVRHRVFGFSLAVQAAQLLQVLFIIWSFDIHGQLPEYLLLFLISGIVAVLPFTIGGVGAREITFLYGANWLGLNPEVAVAISLSFYLMTAFTSFAGIYYHLKPGDLEPGK